LDELKIQIAGPSTIDETLTDLKLSKPMIKPSASRDVSAPDTPPASVDASAENIPMEISENVTVNRQQPIPPPSEPMQFRAIGLVQGKYQPSEERFNRGTLEVDGGVQLDAVLLGQVMSLVKKYVALEQSYLWVVYPRTREKEQTLHLQIVGVWSADGFGPITGQEDPSIAAEETALAEPIEDGYFSVRGQIVYQATDKELLYVKIQQTPRNSKTKEKGGSRDKRGERDKAFKLRVNGVLPQKAVGYFWDLHVKRQGSDLILQEGTSIAQMPVQRHKRPPQRPSKPYSKMPHSAKPNLAYRAQGSGTGVNAAPPRPVQKPIKRQNLSN
jgi:hypothetical protein